MVAQVLRLPHLYSFGSETVGHQILCGSQYIFLRVHLTPFYARGVSLMLTRMEV